jgi:hypothetical protein
MLEGEREKLLAMELELQKRVVGQQDAVIAVSTAVRQSTRLSAETIGTAFKTISARIQRPDTISFLREFGIELEKRVKTQTLMLFGKWKYSQKFGLSFEVTYKNKKKHSIKFGGTYKINKNHTLEANLKSVTGKPLGIELILTKDLAKKDGQAFLRLFRDAEESKVEGGLSFKW